MIEGFLKLKSHTLTDCDEEENNASEWSTCKLQIRISVVYTLYKLTIWLACCSTICTSIVTYCLLCDGLTYTKRWRGKQDRTNGIISPL